jgi:hypothetical protein
MSVRKQMAIFFQTMRADQAAAPRLSSILPAASFALNNFITSSTRAAALSGN